MRPAVTASASPLVRSLGLGGLGLLSLAAITLTRSGATRMYATPWLLLYWGALAAPGLMLITRTWSPLAALRLPARPWLIITGAAVVVVFASALASPYRAQSLLQAALPLAGGAFFLWLHDWLHADPANHRPRLEHCLAWAATVIALISLGYWLADISRLSRDQLFSSVLFDIRNPHPLGHSNYTAGLMLLGLPWLVLAARRGRGSIRRGAWIMSGLLLLILFTSGSRGGLLGLASLGVVALFNAKLGWKRFTLFAGLAVVAAGLLAVANPRIRALLGSREAAAEPNISTVQRAAMFQAGVLMTADRPLLGWGPGSTPLVFPRYRQHLGGGAENVLQLHNAPLEILASLGVAGLLVGVFFLGLAWRNRSRAPVAASALAGYAVFSLTDYQLDVPVVVFALAALAAQLAPPGPGPTSGRLRQGLTLALVLAVALLVALGRRDPTPPLNTEALALARNPALSGRAVTLLNQSLALNPDQEIAHFNLGWLLVVSDPVRAEQHFRAAARLVPDKGGVYFGLGLARLNQSDPAGAARALALECLNEPLFLASPWWKVPALAAERGATTAAFTRLLTAAQTSRLTGDWARRQAGLLATLAPRLGLVSPGPENNYRRERTGYPVLMRNLDLPPPLDLYDVREDPRFPASVPFALPHKGWLPAPLLLKLLDAPPPDPQ